MGENEHTIILFGFSLTLRLTTHSFETLAPGEIHRQAPNVYKEVVQGVKEAFNHIIENRDKEEMLWEQFATCHMKKGLYSLPPTQMDVVTIETIDW